jgi:hypothetical protein
MKSVKRFGVALAVLLLALLCACGTQTQRESVYDTQYDGRIYAVNLDRQTISFDDVVCTFEIVDGSVFQVTYPDGSTYWRDASGNHGCSDDYDAERYVPGDALWYAVFETSSESSGGRYWLAGVVFVIVGVWNIASPRTMWRIRYGWYNQDTAPSAATLAASRGIGVLCVLVGIVFFCI